MKILYISFLLIVIPANILAQSLATFSFDAEIKDSQIVNAEVSSALDGDYNTHIVWIREIGNNRSVMYSFFDNENITTSELISYPNGKPIAPEITLDADGTPHITYIVKRDNDGPLKTGNYAIMYATEENGSPFVLQVSTNPQDPEDDTEREFDAYVNGRPSISIDKNGRITVTYISNSYAGNGYDKHLIQAVRDGDSWIRTSLFNADDFVEGTYDVDQGFSAALTTGNERYLATIDISEYRPQFFFETNGNWNKVILEEFSGTFTSEDIQLYTNVAGSTYMFWFNEGSDPEEFVYTRLEGGAYSDPIRIPVEQNPAGNLFGYTVDRTQDQFYFFYNRSFNSKSYLVTYDENGEPYEIEIDDLGVIYGKRSFHAVDGFVSLVTASEDRGKIYILTGDLVSVTNSELDESNPFSFSLTQNYPNPFNPSTVISFQLPVSSKAHLKVFDLLGREVAELVNEQLPSGNHEFNFDASALSSGIYIYRLEAGNQVQTRKMMLIK